MASETKPTQSVFHAYTDMHGYSDDLWLPFTNGQRYADTTVMDQLYVMMLAFMRQIALTNNASTDFDNPQGSLKGIIAAAYPLGAILSLPLIPIINDRLGRRWSIFIGSFIMVIASLVQGFANSGKCNRCKYEDQKDRLNIHSWFLYRCSPNPWFRHPSLFSIGILPDWRIGISKRMNPLMSNIIRLTVTRNEQS